MENYLYSSLYSKVNSKRVNKNKLKNLIANLKYQHYLVKNLPSRPDGTLPYFNIQTQNIVYLIKPTSHGHKKY